MKQSTAKPYKLHHHLAALLSLLVVCVLALPANVLAIEDPPGCSQPNGGLGNTSVGGINFVVTQAHVGDTVQAATSLGMPVGACRAINATGSIWIATGKLSDYLANVTLDPGTLLQCPGGPLCVPGANNILITAAMVGAGVNTPNGSIPGVANSMRAVSTGSGTVLTGVVTEQLGDFHTATLGIVRPCIQVVKLCAYPANSPTCFPAGAGIDFTGYVTNCGDIRLTNVTVLDSRALLGAGLTDLGGFPLLQPLTLDPGQAIAFKGSFAASEAETCAGSAANTITVRGTDITIIGGSNASVTNSATAACAICANPCLQVTKNCDTVTVGSANTVSGTVTNCGNITLTNIVISDNLYGNLATIPTLAPGASQTYRSLVTNSTCGSFPNTVTAAGRTVCGAPIQAQATATCVVLCAPKICVTKEVVCELSTGCAANWSHLATGAKTADNSQCPSFCYRVRVTNCGQEALNNVTVVDNVINLAGCNFPTTLAVGQTVECVVAGVKHCGNVTNTVTASGVGASSGIGVSTNDTAAVVVLPISITCNVTVNGKPNETIPCDGQGHLITNAVEVCNTGSLPLSDIAINAPDIVALGGACTNVANLRLSLLPGQCTNVVLCTDLVTCPPTCSIAFSNHVRITATVDQTLTNVCSWTRNESNQVVAITASTECSAVVKCLAPPKAGCTPGFWKNCTIHWQPTGYRTDQTVGSVFSVGNCCTSLGNASLLDALKFGGGPGVCGGAQILLRAAVAALLNAASPEVGYPFTTQEVITTVNASLNSCNRATIIAWASELDRNNNLGCRDANGNELPCHRLTDINRVRNTQVESKDP